MFFYLRAIGFHVTEKRLTNPWKGNSSVAENLLGPFQLGKALSKNHLGEMSQFFIHAKHR